MGRRPRFSRAEVEDAALAVLDEHGHTGLTLRAVAARLGTGPMTLYTYVDDRAGLEACAVDAVLRAITLPTGPGPAGWAADVLLISEQVWRAVREHPNAIPLILARRSRSPVFLELAEALLAALGRAGLGGADLLAAFRAVSTLATGFAQTELAGPLSARGGEAGAPEAVVARFRALPADRYPHLVEIADAARTSTPLEEFRSGMRTLLDGLAKAAPR